MPESLGHMLRLRHRGIERTKSWRRDLARPLELTTESRPHKVLLGLSVRSGMQAGTTWYVHLEVGTDAGPPLGVGYYTIYK